MYAYRSLSDEISRWRFYGQPASKMANFHRLVLRGPMVVPVFAALMMIGFELTSFSSIESDQFSWLDGHQLGLQFPSMPDYSLNAIHEKPKD
jgi:hypothetical protein